MPVTADQRYNYAAVKPDNHCHVRHEWASHDALEFPALAGIGGSYRTVMRFFHTVIPWATVFWVFFRRHLFWLGRLTCT